METILRYILPGLVTIIFNVIFYLLIKRRIDSSIEKYKITYSGVFKEKIDIYKSLLQKIHQLKLELNQFHMTDDINIQEALRNSFNELIKTYIINRPFLSDELIALFESITNELQSLYEAFVLASIRSYGNLPHNVMQERDKNYWESVNKLRSGTTLTKIEQDIIIEIRRDLQTLNKK